MKGVVEQIVKEELTNVDFVHIQSSDDQFGVHIGAQVVSDRTRCAPMVVSHTIWRYITSHWATTFSVSALCRLLLLPLLDSL